MKSRPDASPPPTSSAGDVAAWLDALGLGQYAEAFARNDITPSELPLLTDQDLKELGLSLGHRRKLLHATGGGVAQRNAPARIEAREAERRQLTIMFCDLVGSTALSERLDPEDLRQLISAYHDTCAVAITRFGGVVAKFMGDGILAYFGFPRADEHDAERAVRAGLQIVAALRGDRAQSARPLQGRIGITTGPVVVGDVVGEASSEQQAVFGESPNLAARLQDLAQPNTVVISETTRRLVEGLFELDDLGLQPVKGFSRALRAWAVRSERTPESRFGAARSTNLTRFVGREREMADLLACWRKAADGAGQIVLLSGEAGIGKSRVVQQLLESLAQDECLWLRYQCSPLHVNSALYPVIRQIETACRLTPEESADARLEKLTTWLSRTTVNADATLPHYAALLGLSGGGRFPELATAAQRRRTLTALVDHVAAQSRKSPILMVIEDAHWIDPSSLLLLRMLGDRISTVPVLLIVTFRPPFAQLSTQGLAATTIELGRLDRSETAVLIANVAGPSALPAAQVERIAGKADGVPLFVEELTRMMLEADARARPGERDAAAAEPSSELPATLHDLLMARLDNLAPARRVAQIAAVIGREFPLDVLTAVSTLPAQRLNACLDQLIDTGLVLASRSAPDTRFAFRHALLRDAAYSSLLKRDRRALHAAVAGAIERQPARFQLEPELLAHHCTEGGLTEAALRHWSVAGRRALQRAANTEALGMMARALQILGSLPDTPERARQELDLQLVSGGAHWLIKGFGSPDTEQTFRRARALAESLGDGVRLALALRGLAICYFMRGEHGRARAETERLIALSQGAAGAADLMWARMMIGCILFQQGEFIAARAELEAALAMHDPIEQSAKTVSSQLDPGIWARATLAWDLWVLGFPDQALAASAQTMATARAIGQPSSMAVALTYDAIVKLSRRDLDAAGVSAAELRTVATEHHMIYHIAVASLLEGAILVERGACAAGLRLLQQGLAEFRAQQAGSFVPWALAWAAAGCLGDRMTDAALAYLTEGFAAVDAHGERQWEAELRRLKAELLASSPADAGAAESCLREAIQQAGAQGARSPQLRAAAALARMLRARGQLEAARAVLGKAYGQFTEGFATADLRDAKALLDELAPPGRRAGAGSPRRASRATSLPR